MFRALLAHPQEALKKRHLVYWLRMSVGCGTVYRYNETSDALFIQFTENQGPLHVSKLLAHPQKALKNGIWYTGCVYQYTETNMMFIQFPENQGPLHVSSITCSSSGGA
jgi:hypothetical protein